MEIKGMKRFRQDLQSAVDYLGLSEKVKVGLDAVDASKPFKNKIYVGVLNAPHHAEVYMDNLRKEHPNAEPLSSMAYAILHEIGHIYTKNVVEDDEEERVNATMEGTNEAYFALNSERVATQWAVDYAKDHSNTATWFDALVTAAFERFINRNRQD